MTIFKQLLEHFRRKQAPKRYAQLFVALKQARPRSIMEIGTWTGRRGCQMISEASKLIPCEEIHYYGFDLFEGLSDATFVSELSKRPPSLKAVQEEMETSGANIHLYSGDTRVTLPQTYSQLPLMDFIFIDGGHSLETIASDWAWASKLLSQEGVLVFDDYWSNRTDAGAKITVDTIDRDKFTVSLLPIKDTFPQSEFGELTIQLVEVRYRQKNQL